VLDPRIIIYVVAVVQFSVSRWKEWERRFGEILLWTRLSQHDI